MINNELTIVKIRRFGIGIKVGYIQVLMIHFSLRMSSKNRT